MHDVIHLVKTGETLSHIAKQYRTSVNALIHTNNIKDPNRLRIGQLLRVQVDTTFSAPAMRATSGSSAPPDANQKNRPLLVKKLKIVGPPQRGNKKIVACCGWATIQAETYFPLATPEDKKRTRWIIRDEKTRASLVNPGRSEADLLYIDSFPKDWEGRTIEILAYCNAPSENVKLKLTVATSGEVGNFIKLVRKVEFAYPSWSGEKILNSLRRLAGYDNQNFRTMYGGLPVADEIKPLGTLTKTDIDELVGMTRHSVSGATEVGIAKDSLGNALALGHVLTGISAGQHRNKKTDLTPSFSFGFGESMDNLYAATIAGDLGQTAVYSHHRHVKGYIGPGTDATDAELIGDIDGFLIGSNLALHTEGKSLTETNEQGIKLSELLHNYYCVSAQTGMVSNTAFDRFTQFSSQEPGQGNLLDQTSRFATNYVYASESKLKGMFSGADGKPAQESVSAFQTWLGEKDKNEVQRNIRLEADHS